MRILFRLMVAPGGAFVSECHEKAVSRRVWREEGWYVWARVMQLCLPGIMLIVLGKKCFYFTSTAVLAYESSLIVQEAATVLPAQLPGAKWFPIPLQAARE